jgi:hypothetical protein
LSLKELKEMNLVVVAEYAKKNSIIDEHSFDCRALLVIKKSRRLIMASKKRIFGFNYIFGIETSRLHKEPLNWTKKTVLVSGLIQSRKT